MRIDDGQRLIEQNGVDVGAYQAAAERDLLLAIGGQAGCAALEAVGQIGHGGDLATRSRTTWLADAAVAQRKGEIVVDRHGVVDDRELEDLGNVALSPGAGVLTSSLVEQNACHLLGTSRPEMMLSKRCLATAGGPKQGVGAAVIPLQIKLLQRPIVFACRVGVVAVPEIFQG